ncbi:MAG TPA: gephyrin-like molybdotransferase Glp [Bryobacteraceae bacterium]|nr:gephyrin-like molybdotransferase Glp [Bryobacteraceae bacterium]
MASPLLRRLYNPSVPTITTDFVQALPFEQAREMVINAVRLLSPRREVELVSLPDAHRRVLAEDLLADRDYPALRRSLRDGFAVKSSDLPGTLLIRGEVRAGEGEQAELRNGEALEIMTGAPVPEGADAVVMVEHVTRSQGPDGSPLVVIDRAVEPEQFVNRRGAEASINSVLISKGTLLDASHIATLAMAGKAEVPVFRQPSVAILATGDEIVEVSEKPLAHQIRNSNSYMLAALVRASGAKPTVLPVARDTKEALHSLIERGLQYDCLISTGGVSAGKYDLVKPTLSDFGTEFKFERVRIQPGQPTAFGVSGGKPVFGLPGNPGSTLITFQLFARPALELLAGQSAPLQPFLNARFEAPFRHKGGLTRFLPARLAEDGEHLRHIPWQGSSDVPALAKANVFLIADHDRLTWEAGDEIRVMEKL